MRKRIAIAMLAGLLGPVAVGGEAAALPTIDLIWQESGTSGHSLAANECAVLDVILVSDEPLIAATLMGRILDTGPTAPKIVAATNTPPPPLFAVGVFSSDPLPPDGTRVGAFGGLTLGELSAGTYTLGSITIAAGSAAGAYAILPFQRVAIDDWLDSGLNVVVPTLHGATLQVIPEPATVSLVGLGFAILAARRRKAH